MADKSEKSSVTLKRSVTIKAVVTEEFRQYLKIELERALAEADENRRGVEAEYNQRLEFLKANQEEDQIPFLDEQFRQELARIDAMVSDFQQKSEKAKTLEDGSHFVQGNVDGFVTIKKGDDLYQKLGGMEIIVKDGVVQDINAQGTPWL